MPRSPIIFSLFGCEKLADIIIKKSGFLAGKITAHQFPDEESLIKLETDVNDRTVIFLANLNRPNGKILPLLFAAETARELGASKVVLIAPYLPYMRQDKIFKAGEGITSKYFAKLLSGYFDGLITIDPHLHRWHDLNEIYTIPTFVLHATDYIVNWIKLNVKSPILIGPDAESLQWVQDIAEKGDFPYLILEKLRHGDSDVEISLPNIKHHHDLTPILIDDIISTGITLIMTIKQLQSLKLRLPICIGVHAVFANDAYDNLLATGVEKIVTCNTIPHISNGIDVSDALISRIAFK